MQVKGGWLVINERRSNEVKVWSRRFELLFHANCKRGAYLRTVKEGKVVTEKEFVEDAVTQALKKLEKEKV